MNGLAMRPQKVSRGALLFIATLAVAGWMVVDRLPNRSVELLADRKLAAAQRAAQAMDIIRDQRRQLGCPCRPSFDPARSGLIGETMTLVTTRPGQLKAKRTAANPNFAAAILELLWEAGVRPGDTVAVGWSGSLPGFNVGLAAALETLAARPVVVASAAASQYGANQPEFLWLDMEGLLYEAGLISFRSTAASLGGPADRALGMCPDAVALLEQGIARNGVARLPSSRLAESIEARMRHYLAGAGEQPIRAYVNVGGGIASMGGHRPETPLAPGLQRGTEVGAQLSDCVMRRFLSRGTPVVHLAEAIRLAARYDLPVDPRQRPMLGAGALYVRQEPRWGLALLVLLLLAGLMHLAVTGSWGPHWARLRARLRPAWNLRVPPPAHPAVSTELMV